MIIYTFIIMGATFLIGFVVAYIIKIISTTLGYFEDFSLSYEVVKFRRLYAVRKIHHKYLQELLHQAELELNDDLIEFYYPSREDKPQEYDIQNENELTRHYYGEN